MFQYSQLDIILILEISAFSSMPKTSSLTSSLQEQIHNQVFIMNIAVLVSQFLFLL